MAWSGNHVQRSGVELDMAHRTRLAPPGLALVLTVSMAELGVVDRAFACGGYMAAVGGFTSMEEVWRRERSELVSELHRAEEALEHGRYDLALGAIATAWKQRVAMSGWRDDALFDRIDAVAFAAVVFSGGTWTIDDDGRFAATSSPAESRRAVALARDRLLPLARRSQARAAYTPSLAVPLAAEATAVAHVWLTEGANEPRLHHEAAWGLWALYEAGGIVTAEGLAAVSATARAAGKDTLADAARSLCRARALVDATCEEDDLADDVSGDDGSTSGNVRG
jgi:hypothetical protein